MNYVHIPQSNNSRCWWQSLLGVAAWPWAHCSTIVRDLPVVITSHCGLVTFDFASLVSSVYHVTTHFFCFILCLLSIMFPSQHSAICYLIRQSHPTLFFSNLEFNFGFVIPLSIYRDQDVQQTVFISLWRKEMCEDSWQLWTNVNHGLSNNQINFWITGL